MTKSHTCRKKQSLDLPIEIWIAILGYLPRGITWKLIGLNRFLFELGMDEIYDEVRLTDCDARNRKTFEQILQPSIAIRVHHVYIRPSFLPGIDNVGNAVLDRNYRSESKEHARFLKLIFAGLSKCPNIEQFTIVLYDCFHTPTFLSFFRDILHCLVSQIKDISLQVTPASFISINSVLPSSFPSLSSLTVSLCTTRLQIGEHRSNELRRSLSGLIASHHRTITNLAIENLLMFDLADLFRDLPDLPLMRSFKVRLDIAQRVLSRPTELTSFLQRNAEHLEHLSIVPPTWPPPSASAIVSFSTGLFSSKLLRLKVLQAHMDDYFHACLTRHIAFTPTESFAPNLTELDLTGAFSVFDHEFYLFLKRLTPPAGEEPCSLQLARLLIPRFCSGHLDYFSKLYPKLQSLELRYHRAVRITTIPADEDTNTNRDLVYSSFHVKQYPGWLKHMRVMQVNDDHEDEFDVDLINAIAVSLPVLEHMCGPGICGRNCQIFAGDSSYCNKYL